MHPISRPCFCGPRSPIDEWARSGPRRRPTVWGTWPPNLWPPIGINHLVREADAVIGPPAASPAGAKRELDYKWIASGVVIVGALMSILSQTVVTVALPT